MPKVIDESKNIIIINNPGIPFFLFSYVVYSVHKNLLNILFVEDILHFLDSFCVIPFHLDVAALIIDNAFAAQKPRDINLTHGQVSTGRCIAICMYQV